MTGGSRLRRGPFFLSAPRSVSSGCRSEARWLVRVEQDMFRHGRNPVSRTARFAWLSSTATQHRRNGFQAKVACRVAVVQSHTEVCMSNSPAQVEHYRASGSVELGKLGEAFRHARPMSSWPAVADHPGDPQNRRSDVARHGERAQSARHPIGTRGRVARVIRAELAREIERTFEYSSAFISGRMTPLAARERSTRRYQL
jgi:hypothetical protein